MAQSMFGDIVPKFLITCP